MFFYRLLVERYVRVDMKTIFQLSKRHLLVFFRNKSEVFFSLLSVFVVLALYVLFLGDMTINNVKAISGLSIDGIEALVHSWLFAGLTAIGTITLSIGLLSRMVFDRENKTFNDFLVAPIKRHELFLSYVVATFFVVLGISLLVLLLGQFIFVLTGGFWYSIVEWIQIVGFLLLVSLSSSMSMLFVLSFIKNESVLSFLSTIVGTLIGFVIGAYVPIGVMHSSVAMVSSLLPISQGAALLRQALMRPSLDFVFSGAPAQVISEYNKFQGIELYVNDTKLSVQVMVIYLIITTIIFMGLNVWRFRKMKI